MNDLLDRFAMAESGGNINARSPTPLSSAQGLFGFTDAAFNQVKQDNPDLANVSKEQWAVDPQLQRTFAERLQRFHEGVLKNNGLDTNPVNMYANWHFGSGGGPKFLKSAPNTPMELILDPVAIAANPHLQGKTQAEVMQLLSRKVGTALPNAVAQNQGTTTMNPNQPTQIPAAADPMQIYQMLQAQQRNAPLQQLTPEQREALTAGRQLRASMLPMAIGASLAGDKRVSAMGGQLYKDSMAAQGATQIGDEGWLTSDGQLIENPLTASKRDDSRSDRLLQLSITAANSQNNAGILNTLRQEQIKQAQAGNQPANVVTLSNGTQVVDTNAPWGNMNATQSQTMRNQTMSNAQKQLGDMREATQGDQSTLQMLDQFTNLNQKEPTGGIWDKYGPSKLQFGDTATMQAIQNKLTPLQRPPGSGATSDFEQKMYALGIPNIGNKLEVNQQIKLANEALIKVREARLNHYEKHLAQYGHLNGAEESFKPIVQQIERQYAPKIDAYSSNNKPSRPTALPRATGAANGTGGGLTPEEQRELDELRSQFRGR